ncbi:MAG: glycoside hydrolase family 127 protein, partial [Armatimonadetes bacterium]|nr:glycoside hydrolase family 127 protein [Armatimonadota bacterium]
MPLRLMFCLTSAALAAPDATQFLPPADVQLSGWLGHRLTTNARERLLKVDEDAVLSGYRRRPGSHPWIGEHVGKFLHATTLAWANSGDPELKAKIDRVAKALIACQEEDGYLGTYSRETRWTQTGATGWDVWSHKYCLFGLLTWWQYTKDAAALDCCRKAGDLLVRTFGPGAGQLNLMERSTHVGMASSSVLQPMVMLYRATGDRRYLDWCRYVVDAWETAPGGPRIVSTLLAGKGVNQTANGKAYEMMSCLTGAVDLSRALRDDGKPEESDRLLAACRHAWDDIAAKRLYITGGTSCDEHFRADGDLPNTGNVSETCAVVTLEQLSLELFRLAPEARYMDVLEQSV